MKGLHLLMCLGADFDCAYISHLCRHYTPAVDSWNVLLHSNERGKKGKRSIEKARRAFESGLAAASSTGVLNTREWCDEFNSDSKAGRLNDMAGELVPPGEWVLYVDADEFVESPGNFESLMAQCTSCQQTVVYGRMVDRFASDRKPHPIHDEDDLFVKFPLCEEYTKTVLRASTQKPCLMKYQGVPLLLNCHDYTGQSSREYQSSGRPFLTVWHFKWVGSTREKLNHRVNSFKHQRLIWWRESARSLKEIYGELEPGSVAPVHDDWRPRRLGRVQERDRQQLRIQVRETAVQLNPTATLIWERCDGTRTEAQILAELCEHFAAPEDVLRRDLREALNGLIAAGALEIRHQRGPGPLWQAGNPPRVRLGLVSETSAGFLNQVKLCLFSLRKNGGALSDLPVTLITNSEPLRERDARFLNEHFPPIEFKTSPRLGAIPHTSKLNVFYSIDPSEYDVLMFMDCDTVVRGPLDRLLEPILYQGADFLCRRGGETDRNRFVDFDALVTRFCERERKEKMLYEGQSEWPMFNSGVFLATSDAVQRIRKCAIEFTYRLFNEWQRNNALKELPDDVKQNMGYKQEILESWPIEQGALALSCINAGVKVRYLQEAYNSWGGDPDFRILHSFKSLYQFNRRSMFSAVSEKWIEDYLRSDIPGKVFLASTVREYKQEFPAGDLGQSA